MDVWLPSTGNSSLKNYKTSGIKRWPLWVRSNSSHSKHNVAPKATIMLAANCAFLAIPVLDNQGPGPDPHSSLEQVASYLSLAASLFGLILSMVMSRQHKAKGPNSVKEIVGFHQKELWLVLRSWTDRLHLWHEHQKATTPSGAPRSYLELAACACSVVVGTRWMEVK